MINSKKLLTKAVTTLTCAAMLAGNGLMTYAAENVTRTSSKDYWNDYFEAYADETDTYFIMWDENEAVVEPFLDMEKNPRADINDKSVITIDHMSIVKESIIPMYIMDVYSYAETGVLKIYPEVYELNNSEINVFQVDLMTDDGKYGGVIQFYIKDGKAYHLLEIPSHHKLMKEGTEPANKNYEIINGYFTNVENVKKVLKIENISDRDEKDIRYVTVEGLREKYFTYSKL